MSEEKESKSQTSKSRGPKKFGYAVRSWVNPMYVCADDTNYAITTAELDEGDETKTMLANDFRFAIPGSATIRGVEVKIQSKGNDPDALITHVLRLTTGTTDSDSRADHGCNHPWSDAFGFHHSGGNATDLWGLGLTPSVVNNSSFGVKFGVENCESAEDARPYVDYIQMTVWYDNGSGVEQAGPNLPFFADNIP